jgi:flagellar protein FliO/FliZ
MTTPMMPSLMSLVWLLVIVMAIPLALWLLKRSGYAGSGGRTLPGGARVVSQTALSPQQRIVTIEVGEGAERCWLVLGVTAQQMTVLHRLTPPGVEPAPSQPGEPAARRTPAAAQGGPGFARMLQQWRSAAPEATVSSHGQ